MNVLYLCYNTMIFFSDVLYTSDPPLYSVGYNKSLFPTECECVRFHGRKSDRMTFFWLSFFWLSKLHIIPSPLPSRGGGRGRRERKGHSIFVVTISRVSQFSLVTPLNSVSDDWSYLRSLCKPGDPPPPARPAHPPTPLSKRKMVTYSLLLLSAFQRM